MKVFKAYDIRGHYPEQVNEDLAFKLGIAYSEYTGAKKVVVGYDMRPSSPCLFSSLVKGLTSQGVDVINIGLCSTPICYFANGTLGVDGSIMITASHNGRGWNGFKMCKAAADPLSYKRGLKEIEAMINEGKLPGPAEKPGQITELSIGQKYADNVKKYVKFSNRLKIVVDYGNSVGVKEIEGILDLFEVIPLFEELDGTFPNHEANPLKTETLRDLQKAVTDQNAVFGAAFDGDADRCGFVDEKGEIIGMDLITALIAEDLINQTGPQTILYDLRSSKAVPEAIEKAGGKAYMTPVGHAVIKENMRKRDAAFAGELSGHYYFRENFYSESQAIVLILLCNIIEHSGKTLSELIEPLKKYKNTGEINCKVKNIPELITQLKEHYTDAELTELDGASFEYNDWWCNIRPSNTEPLLRVFVEANTEQILKEKTTELLSLIKPFEF
ncbi:MAG: phosphomannomutase/phosphoglucomutase [Lentisphaerales bacterium]|nr:phosphomannomutase/phosphoglucomutase [Lentisphaerales bacterium]